LEYDVGESIFVSFVTKHNFKDEVKI